MMLRKRNKSFIWFIPFLILIFVTLACGSSTSEKLQDSVSPIEESQTDSEINSSFDDAPTETATKEPTEAPTEEPTEAPTVTPSKEIQKLELVKQGFGQDDSFGSYAFILENPNQNSSINNSKFQIAIYDANDTILTTESGYIDVVLPGQILGIAGDLYLDEGQVISKIEVQIKDGDPENADPMPTIETSNINYFIGDYFSYVTGEINNPYDIDLTDLRVSAILYDVAENIIGGGYTYLDFILANTSTGISILMEDYGDVNSIEIYPIISGWTFFESDSEKPEDAASLSLTKFGLGNDAYGTGYGFLVENPNSNYTLEESQYHVTGYSADGSVLCTDEGYINSIFPNQILGIGGDLYPASDAVLDYIEIQIKDGKFVESEIVPFFTAENAQFINDAYFPKVTGTIVNPYTSDISDLIVNAIAYNEAGDIIGGGYTYIDFILAGGKTAAEVSITVSDVPASVELYATFSYLSAFEN